VLLLLGLAYADLLLVKVLAEIDDAADRRLLVRYEADEVEALPPREPDGVAGRQDADELLIGADDLDIRYAYLFVYSWPVFETVTWDSTRVRCSPP
jgi:hypothetical protein